MTDDFEQSREPTVEKRLTWAKLEPISRFVLAVSAAVVAWMSYLSQSGDRQRNRDEAVRSGTQQVRMYHSSAEAARRASAAAASATLLSLIVTGARPERKRGLAALMSISPLLAADLSFVVLESAEDNGELELARQINIEATKREAEDTFLWHIRLARDMFSKRFDEATCDEYRLAWNSLTESYGKLIDKSTIDRGLSQCSAPVADYKQGATNLHKGFGGVRLYESR